MPAPTAGESDSSSDESSIVPSDSEEDEVPVAPKRPSPNKKAVALSPARGAESARSALARAERGPLDHQVLLVVRVVLVRVRVAALDARKFFFLEYKGCIHEFKISGLEYVFS